MLELPSSRLSTFRPGTLFQQYRLFEMIGSGGQGVVWSALDQPHGRIVAIKFNEVQPTDQKRIDDHILERQADRLLTLRHPHILPLYDFGLLDQLRYMASPYITGGSLAEWLMSNHHSIDEVLRFGVEIASALDYLHSQGVVHRDLKPGNVLIDLSQNAYVADFGLARFVSDSTAAMHTGRGTPPYAPPEQHSMASLTTQSDIFNFGVMLYELLTLQLPWDGERALGLEQLSMKAELPDPCEANPKLPPSLAGVLRQMTAADPLRRPQTAGNAMRRLLDCFEGSSRLNLEITAHPPQDENVVRSLDTQTLLKRSLGTWRSVKEKTVVSLTKFALIDLECRRVAATAIPPEVMRFILHHALVYGYNDEYWWNVFPFELRLNTALTQLASQTEEAAARTVSHLLDDSGLRQFRKPFPEALFLALLHTAEQSDNPWLRQESLQVLLELTPAAGSWQTAVLNPERDRILSSLVARDPADGHAAALIGHVRSSAAVQQLIRELHGEKRNLALRRIQAAAGSLPPSVPFEVRASLALQWIVDRLFSRPVRSLIAFTLAASGSTLGFAIMIYFSYRLPNYMDSLRWSLSLERGLLLGIPIGLGILLIRLMVERTAGANAWLRFFLASLVGGAIIYFTLWTFDSLALNTPPVGALLALACYVLAAGFALASLVRNFIGRTAIALVATWTTIGGSWLVHLNWTYSTNLPTPIFTFEYSASFLEVAAATGLAGLCMAILGNLVRLDEK